jgi:hypothetical protein
MRKAATILLAVTVLVPGAACAYTSMPAAASTAPVWSPAGASPWTVPDLVDSDHSGH